MSFVVIMEKEMGLLLEYMEQNERNVSYYKMSGERESMIEKIDRTFKVSMEH